MEERISIVKEIEKTLIFVDFTVHRETEFGLLSLSVGKPTTTAQRSVFDVLMSSSIFFCGRDDLMENVSEVVFIENGFLLSFFTGNAMQEKDFVILQMSCTLSLLSTHQLWTDLICAVIALNLLDKIKTHKIILPVCLNCVQKGIPKRMHIK